MTTATILRVLLKAHVKAHYRVVNGKVVHIAEHDDARPQGRPAELHERTAVGKHKDGSHYLRATDAEDAEHIKGAAGKLGIPIEQRRSGANHHGRVGAYNHYHVQDPSHAAAILDELKKHSDQGDKIEAELGLAMPEDNLTKAKNAYQKKHGSASAGGNPPSTWPKGTFHTKDGSFDIYSEGTKYVVVHQGGMKAKYKKDEGTISYPSAEGNPPKGEDKPGIWKAPYAEEMDKTLVSGPRGPVAHNATLEAQRKGMEAEEAGTHDAHAEAAAAHAKAHEEHKQHGERHGGRMPSVAEHAGKMMNLHQQAYDYHEGKRAELAAKGGAGDAPEPVKPASEAPGHKIPAKEPDEAQMVGPKASDHAKAALGHAMKAPKGKEESVKAATATKDAEKAGTAETHKAAEMAHWAAAKAHDIYMRKTGSGVHMTNHQNASDQHSEAAKAHHFKAKELSKEG